MPAGGHPVSSSVKQGQRNHRYGIPGDRPDVVGVVSGAMQYD